MVQKALQDPVLGDLLADMVEAARTARSTEKLRGLARALVAGYLAADDARLDEAVIAGDVMRQLDAPHIKVLDYLVTRGGRYSGVPDVDIAALFQHDYVHSYYVLKRLESFGLAGPQNPPTPDPDKMIRWVPWDFGVALHARLLEADDSASSTSPRPFNP